MHIEISNIAYHFSEILLPRPLPRALRKCVFYFLHTGISCGSTNSAALEYSVERQNECDKYTETLKSSRNFRSRIINRAIH